MPTETIYNQSVRQPVIAILGHIDHGKSTLLDYIRETNIVETEAGNITQRLSAYEVVHKNPGGIERKITFLDTPGHEAFVSMRSRGVGVADIVVLVISAEEGVKAQTIEGLKTISEAGIPYIVAINKIDKPQADIERTKNSLLENGIYLEGYGGDVPFVPISAKTGAGVPELLDMMLLVADLAELKTDPAKNATGFVIEAHLDQKKGIAATLIVLDGTLKSGMFLVAGDALAPTRILQDFLGRPLQEAHAGQPVRVIGWNKIPLTGIPFTAYEKKKDAEAATKIAPPAKSPDSLELPPRERGSVLLPLILKADTAGTLDAILHELGKIEGDRVRIKILQRGTGNVSEGDLKLAQSVPGAVIVRFNSGIDGTAADIAARLNIQVEHFTVIYEFSKWAGEEMNKRRPVEEVKEITGRAKVLKIFSKMKDRQVLGARILEGSLSLNASVKIMRRGEPLGIGSIVNLQQQKVDVKKVGEGEFGGEIKAKIDAAPGDELEGFVMVKK